MKQDKEIAEAVRLALAPMLDPEAEFTDCDEAVAGALLLAHEESKSRWTFAGVAIAALQLPLLALIRIKGKEWVQAYLRALADAIDVLARRATLRLTDERSRRIEAMVKRIAAQQETEA